MTSRPGPAERSLPLRFGLMIPPPSIRHVIGPRSTQDMKSTKGERTRHSVQPGTRTVRNGTRQHGGLRATSSIHRVDAKSEREQFNKSRQQESVQHRHDNSRVHSCQSCPPHSPTPETVGGAAKKQGGGSESNPEHRTILSLKAGLQNITHSAGYTQDHITRNITQGARHDARRESKSKYTPRRLRHIPDHGMYWIHFKASIP